MDWIDAILKLSQVGATALLLLALFGAHQGWWVAGWIYREGREREAAWKTLYEREKIARDEERSARQGGG